MPESSNDNVPSDAVMELLSPDGYYRFLGVAKTMPTEDSGREASPIDEDKVKKAYRKLSLKHHPDKPGGDIETFRMLNRAQKVLTTPGLRKQYDIIGIDLDDDDGEEEDDDRNGDEDEATSAGTSTAQKIMQEIAQMALTSIIQMTIRTALMGGTSVILVRYRWTLYPALCFLAFVSVQIIRRAPAIEAVPTGLIAVGLLLMHQTPSGEDWRMTFWLGETTVITVFVFNSVKNIPNTPLVLGALFVVSSLLALWFRGKFWNYATVVGLEVFAGVFVALAFPVFELLLEALLNEKMRKVGDKVRFHHSRLEAYYRAKAATAAGGTTKSSPRKHGHS